MSKIYLKVKIKSLADEAKIIRREERQAILRRDRKEELGNYTRANQEHKVFEGLREHRMGIVRSEARAAQLAYGFIKGKKYAEIEPKQSLKDCKVFDEYHYNEHGLVDRVGRLIAKYGNYDNFMLFNKPYLEGERKPSPRIHYKILTDWLNGKEPFKETAEEFIAKQP